MRPAGAAGRIEVFGVTASGYSLFTRCLFALRRMDMAAYRELEVLQRARELIKEVYALMEFFPPEEKYALSDQLRRSVTSVAFNISEGQGRRTGKEFLNFLNIAKASNAEVYTQLVTAVDLGYINEKQVKHALVLSTRINQMLDRLMQAVMAKNNTRNKS